MLSSASPVSSFRAPCIFDMVGKTYTKLRQSRILSDVEDTGIFSLNTAFTRVLSIIDILREVVEEAAQMGNYHSRNVTVLRTWTWRTHLIQWAGATFRVPGNFMWVMEDYLRGRTIPHRGRTKPEEADRWWRARISPDFWNVAYDSLLRIVMRVRESTSCYY